jgi:hypothetical protein
VGKNKKSYIGLFEKTEKPGRYLKSECFFVGQKTFIGLRDQSDEIGRRLVPE